MHQAREKELSLDRLIRSNETHSTGGDQDVQAPLYCQAVHSAILSAPLPGILYRLGSHTR